MLNPAQKIHVVASAAALTFQAAMVSKLLADHYRLQNMGNAAAEVFNKHHSNLDDIDKQRLIRAGFRRNVA